MTTPLKIHGVDISHYQDRTIGWTSLKEAGVQWMYHKATEGSSYRDSNYLRRRNEAKAAKMPFGAYHFARPESKADALSEARFFISFAKPLPGDLRPCLDLETMGNLSYGEVVAWADLFCTEVERLTSVTPLVYTPYRRLSPELEHRALFWVPRYNSDNHPPTQRWDIWQFSDGQYGVPNRVPGLGNVDLNHSKVVLQDLLIPKAAEPVLTRGPNVDEALKNLYEAERAAKDESRRDTLIKRAMRNLKKIDPRKK